LHVGLGFKKCEDQVGFAFLIVDANGLRVQAGELFFCCMGQGLEQDHNIPDVSGEVLISMHAPGKVSGRRRQEGRRDLRHVAEPPESDARVVDAVGLVHVHLSIRQARPRVSVVDRSQELRREILI
jgi:hypothetical protein